MDYNDGFEADEITRDRNYGYDPYYTPDRYDECRSCGHPYFQHNGETHDGSDSHCTYESDEGVCECVEFEP